MEVHGKTITGLGPLGHRPVFVKRAVIGSKNNYRSGPFKVTAHTWAIFFPKNNFFSFFDIL